MPVSAGFRSGGVKAEDAAWVVLTYPNATAIIEGGWWVRPDVGANWGELVIAGPHGVLRKTGEKVVFQKALPAQPAADAAAEPVPVEYAALAPEPTNGVVHFLDCIRTGKPVEEAHSPKLNIVMNEIVDAAYESIRTCRAVMLGVA